MIIIINNNSIIQCKESFHPMVERKNIELQKFVNFVDFFVRVENCFNIVLFIF
uniref:Uncharacterized protein n=1 Tax=Octopus bimaculoides TaxID=37653 RepID=A0A0L8FK06_OCTBM